MPSPAFASALPAARAVPFCAPQRRLHPSCCASPPPGPPSSPPPPPPPPPPPRARRGLRVLEAPGSVFSVAVLGVRAGWNAAWRVMMAELAPSTPDGDYARPPSQYLARGGGGVGGARGAPALFVGPACQWCHRVLLARALLRVPNAALPLVRLAPGTDGLWRLEAEGDAAVWGARLKGVYAKASRGQYRGRATAPLLVAGDVAAGDVEIVSNESSDILRVIPEVFGDGGGVDAGGGVTVWLRPPPGSGVGVDAEELDTLCERVYSSVNNGVYRCGFAATQEAYERAEAELHSALEECEARLGVTRFLMSPTVLTEADVRLFPTMQRFDAVYARLFRCGRRTVRGDYPAIAGWMRDIYAMPGVKETCELEATCKSYYSSLFMLNPGGIIPRVPEFDWDQPHGRESLGLMA